MAKERRMFQRVEGIVNVRYAVRDRDKNRLESLPRNIGGGGVGICLTEKLQQGTVLELEITAPDNPEKAILGVGEVLWTKPFGTLGTGKNVSLHETGIKFIDIDPVSIGRIYTYLHQQRHSSLHNSN